MSWSLEWYSCFGAWSGTQGLELGVVLRFGAWSDTQDLELGVVFRFRSLE